MRQIQRMSVGETSPAFDVSRTAKILCRPGPKWRSMSHGRQRFYVTSRRIFVVRAESFERTTVGREAMMARISKAAQQLFAEVVDICARSLWKRKLGPFSKLTHIV